MITLRCNSQPQPLLNLCTPRIFSSNVGSIGCGISSNMYCGGEVRSVREWLVLAGEMMTPFLTAKLAGKYVAVDASGLLVSTLQVVLFPVLAGAFLNQFFQPFVKLVSPLMPPIAVTTVTILCRNAIAQSSSGILVCGGQVILAIFLLHASGFFFGYLFVTMLALDVSSSQTISTQVGIKL
ncbi:hypothetical protein VNO78_13460 [Psophocarpus tetragonolobus]|uniref:Uncharacterized protein n=1 Tax=Psophocarpus tetragonolobus TaxID=3891 RepID=A0AAN9SYX2_PSOTE